MGLLVPSRSRGTSYPAVLQDIVLRDFDGLWNQADNDLNLQTKYFNTLLNWERKEDATIGPRYGYTKYADISNRAILDVEISFETGTNLLSVESAGHGLVEGSIVTFSDFPTTPSSYLGITLSDLTQSMTVIGPITNDTFNVILRKWTTATGDAVSTPAKMQTEAAVGDIINIAYFQNRLIYITDEGYIGSINDQGVSKVLWSPGVVQLATLNEDASPDAFLRTVNGSNIVRLDLGQALYNIQSALTARVNHNEGYFDTTIPSSATKLPPYEFFTNIPPRLQDGWTSELVLPGLGDTNNNRIARDLITKPKFPLVDLGGGNGFIDPDGRIRIDKAPDNSPGCLRVRVDNDFPASDAMFKVDSFPNGVDELAISARVFFQSDYDWGNPATDFVSGELGFGLWIGGKSWDAYDDVPPEYQDGVWITPIWSNGNWNLAETSYSTSGQTGAFFKINSYHLNRKQDRDLLEEHGKEAGGIDNLGYQIARNAWLNFDLHAKMNTPGKADGFIRFWINGSMVVEIINVVLSLDDKWKLHGFLFNDRWGNVDEGLENYIIPTVDQSYYIKELNYWRPEEQPNQAELITPQIGSLIQLAGWSGIAGIPAEQINRVHVIEAIVGDQYHFRVLKAANATTQSIANQGIAKVSTSAAWADTPFASYAVHNRKLLIGNGRDKPVVIDFLETNSIQFLRDPATDSNVNTPIGKYIAVGANYTVWAGNPLEPGTIYISATGTNNTYEGDPAPNDATRMDVSKLSSSSNGEITGLTFHKGNLWVSFDNEYVIIQLGVYTEELHTPTVVDVLKNFGGISHRGMISVGELFYSTDTQGVVSIEESLLGESFRPKYASDLIAPHLSHALSTLSILDQQEQVWAFYDKRMSRYMLFVPRGTGTYHTYVYTLLPDRKIGGWQLFRGYDFTCGVRSELNRLFVAKGQKVYYLGNSSDEVYSDDGQTVQGVLELPWMDFNKRNLIKKLKYMSFDTVGDARFGTFLFIDGYYENLEQIQLDSEANPNTVYDEFTLPLIPQVEQWFAASNTGGWGGGKQTYGGGRRTARNALIAMSATFKQMKIRLYFNNNKKMNLVSIIMSYQVGSIRR